MNITREYMCDIINLFIYIAQSDEVIGHDEVKFFDDYFRIRTGDENLFGRTVRECGIDIYRIIGEDEIVNSLGGYGPVQKVTAMIDSFGLALADTVNPEEERRFISLCKRLGFDNRTMVLMEEITGFDLGAGREDVKSEIITIGNNPELNDILVRDSDINARIFLFEGKVFIFGLNSKGLVLINDSRIIINGITSEIKDGDYLNLGRFNIYYAEILRRIYRKVEGSTTRFDLTLDKTGGGLAVHTENNIIPPDASVIVTGNSCRLIIHTDSLCFLIDDMELTVRDHETLFSLDQNLFVKPAESGCMNGLSGFELKLPLLLNELMTRESVSIEGSKKEVKHISNNNTSADIFLESLYTNDSSRFVDLYVSIDNTSVLRVENRGVAILFNHEPLEQEVVTLKNHDTLKIGREVILFDFDNNKIVNHLARIESVDVNSLSFRYGDNDTGLDDISFSGRLGEMTCIMGPSGCGKSTLMKVMLGYEKATAGSVRLNGLDFHKNFNDLKDYVGYVPQDDLLYENLSVYENLYYSGKLKLPDISDDELRSRIDDLLVVLGLSDKRDLPVGNELKRTLSGGERRRLNIGLELLNDSDVIYLDEPTSGLSSYDSRKVIELLSGYAEKGKIIYVVIHQPAPEIFYKFDRLILLDYGGKLAFFGDTKKAVRYFISKSDRIKSTESGDTLSPDVILEVLQEVQVDLSGREIFEISESGNRVPVRVRTPLNWKNIFIEYRNSKERMEKTSIGTQQASGLTRRRETFSERMTRFRALFARNFMDRIRDRSALIMAFIAPMLLVAVLSCLMRTGSAPAFLSAKDFYVSANRILDNDKKNFYEDDAKLILDSYTPGKDGNFRYSGHLRDMERDHISAVLAKGTYESAETTALMKSGVPEKISSASFREALLASKKFESDFYTFLCHYKPDGSSGDFIFDDMKKGGDSEEKKKDIHKIFRDAGIDRYLFKHNPNFPKFLFLTVIILIFLGLTSSINELQKDRPKIMREKLLNIRPFDYLLSKFITTVIFAFVQTVIYVAGAILIIKIPFSVPELGFYGLGFIASFFAISLASMLAASMLGYYISSLVNSEKTILILIPVVMIPQIIFGGLFLSYDDMGGRIFQKDRPVPLYCELVFSRWGYEGLVASCFDYNPSRMWSEIVEGYNRNRADGDPDVLDVVEKRYDRDLALKYNDESRLEILDAKKRWNFNENINYTYESKSFAVTMKNIMENHDPFPVNEKKIYNSRFSAIGYNLTALIFFIVVLFLLTLKSLRRIRGV